MNLNIHTITGAIIGVGSGKTAFGCQVGHGVYNSGERCLGDIVVLAGFVFSSIINNFLIIIIKTIPKPRPSN